MPIDLTTATTEQLERILELRKQIDALQNELNQITGEETTSAPAAAPAKRGRPPGKRSFSPETRRKMAEAQRARWAAKQGTPAPAKEEKADKKSAGKKKVNPKLLENLAKARAARAAKRAAAAA